MNLVHVRKHLIANNKIIHYVCNGCRYYKAFYVHSQAQWVLFAAKRSEVVSIGMREFKWDQAKEWARKCYEHFNLLLGFGFEDPTVEAVNYATFSITGQKFTLLVQVMSGSRILEEFSFLEQFLPSAGTVMSAAGKFCVLNTTIIIIDLFVLLYAGRIVSGNKSSAVLFNIAQMSNKRETEGAVVAKASAPAVQCQEGGKRSVEVVMEVGEQPTQGPLLKKKRSEKKAFVPRVLDGEELKKAMAGFQAAVEPAVPVGGCWQCEGCTGNNPPSAQTCLIEGCGLARAQEVLQVVEQVEKIAAPIAAEPMVKAHTIVKKSKKSSRGGRKVGATNTYVPVNKLQRFPNVSSEQNYWKEHKMVCQNRTIYGEVNGKRVKVGRKAQKKCHFFRQSGMGMCPQLLALGSVKNDGRCSKFCRSCKKPFHEICTWVYHSAVLQGFDANNWVKEVWIRELLESDEENESSIEEECSDSSSSENN